MRARMLCDTHNHSVVPSKDSKLIEASHEIPSSGGVASYEDSKREGGERVHRSGLVASYFSRMPELDRAQGLSGTEIRLKHSKETSNETTRRASEVNWWGASRDVATARRGLGNVSYRRAVVYWRKRAVWGISVVSSLPFSQPAELIVLIDKMNRLEYQLHYKSSQTGSGQLSWLPWLGAGPILSLAIIDCSLPRCPGGQSFACRTVT